jgi:hypothetical protein
MKRKANCDLAPPRKIARPVDEDGDIVMYTELVICVYRCDIHDDDREVCVIYECDGCISTQAETKKAVQVHYVN